MAAVYDEDEYSQEDYNTEDDPVTFGSAVTIWYQREDDNDFIVRICYKNSYNGYKVRIEDNDSRDPIYNEHVFETFENVQEYLTTLHKQIMNDHDAQNRFTHFQYAIPFFPSVIVPNGYIRNHPDHYQCFLEGLELFFRY
jgi:hypothetical protein